MGWTTTCWQNGSSFVKLELLPLASLIRKRNESYIPSPHSFQTKIFDPELIGVSPTSALCCHAQLKGQSFNPILFNEHYQILLQFPKIMDKQKQRILKIYECNYFSGTVCVCEYMQNYLGPENFGNVMWVALWLLGRINGIGKIEFRFWWEQSAFTSHW